MAKTYFLQAMSKEEVRKWKRQINYKAKKLADCKVKQWLAMKKNEKNELYKNTEKEISLLHNINKKYQKEVLESATDAFLLALDSMNRDMSENAKEHLKDYYKKILLKR